MRLPNLMIIARARASNGFANPFLSKISVLETAPELVSMAFARRKKMNITAKKSMSARKIVLTIVLMAYATANRMPAPNRVRMTARMASATAM